MMATKMPKPTLQEKMKGARVHPVYLAEDKQKAVACAKDVQARESIALGDQFSPHQRQQAAELVD